MPRKAAWPPPIYTSRGRWYARVWRDGRRKDYPLGPADSDEARAAYVALQAELLAPAPAQTPAPATVAALVLAWDRGRRPRYAGTQEEAAYRRVLGLVTDLHGRLPADRFGPVQLTALARHMAELGWCRRYANRQLTRVKTAWRWLEGEGLAPAGSWHALLAVRGLDAGEARDTGEVLPVPEELLARTLPELGRVVRAAVQVQLLTGARPGEVLALRPGDLQRGGAVQLGPGSVLPLGPCWAALPGRHKTAWRGHRRLILFGPRAQAALEPYLARPADLPLFSPREAAEDYLRAHGRRAAPRSRRAPGERYSLWSYGSAIAAACDRATPPPEPLARRQGETWRQWHARLTDADRAALDSWRKAHRWHPGQLRHNAATRLVAEFGWEVARLVLGHRSVEMTRRYAVDHLAAAVDAVGRAG